MSSTLDTFKLANMLKAKRGNKGLRAIAEEIGGVSASTLSRIEQGNVPDIDTFLLLCKWLDVPANFFTKGVNEETQTTQQKIIAHLRADRTLPPNTASALAQMITLAYESATNAPRKKK